MLPALAEGPYAKPDDTWVSVDGAVEEVSADSFTLDYGQGIITVEMDDGNRDADSYKLVEGDRVTVNGIIDDDFYEIAKIEASSVYVENIGTYSYASAVDEEHTFATTRHPITVSKTVVQGEVSGVAGEGFTIDTGERMLTVEVDDMLYNPLDDEGYQKIEKGDTVSVTGNIDRDLFEGRALEADAVITLYHNEKSQ